MMTTSVPDPRFSTSVPRPRLASGMRGRIPGGYDSYGQGAGAAAPSLPAPSGIQVGAANEAAGNAAFAAAAPPIRPSLRGTTPGSMSITLNPGEKPAETQPGDTVDTASNGYGSWRSEKATVARQGTMPLQSAEDEAATANARRQAYITRQTNLSRYLYPGMQDQQLKQDANARANQESAAGVANIDNERKQMTSDRNDFKTQLAARDKALNDLRAEHAAAIAELRQQMAALREDRMGRAAAANEDAKATAAKNKADNDKRRGDQAAESLQLRKDALEYKKQSNPLYKPPTTQPAPQQGKGRLPTKEEIGAILHETNGDPDKAAQLALQRGFSVYA